jgi:hypothetical protein
MPTDIPVLIFVNRVAGYGRTDPNLIARIRSNHVAPCVQKARLNAINDTKALEEQLWLPRSQRTEIVDMQSSLILWSLKF